MKALLLAIVVIAHRGEHLHHPENTLPAFEAALDAGADFYEVDVRTTRDGRLVLMHDATVNRTTNGKGRVSELTFDEVQALRCGEAPVPTFEQALELARRRNARVYVDAKDITVERLVSALDQYEMQERVVVYGGAEFLRRIQQQRPLVRIMPEAGSLENARHLVAELHPRVMAFNAKDWKPGIIAVARDAKTDLYVDRLGADDNPAGWQAALDAGATGIQTDKPAELVEYLRGRGLHR